MLCFVSIKVWQVTPCGAIKSALRLPPSFWNCLCLAILFLCLNLVPSSPYSAGEIRKALLILIVQPHGSGVISEACVVFCA